MLLLGRGLAPTEFGIFALINSICLLMFGFHANLIISPLVVLGAPANPSRSRTYPTAAMCFTFLLLPASFLAVFLASVSLHREQLGLTASLYVLAWQLQETTRRSLTAKLRYREAILGDAISYLGQALFLGVLMMCLRTTLTCVFAVMTATSLFAATLQCWQGRFARPTWNELRHHIGDFWILARWLIVVSLASALAGPLFPWLLNWFHGKSTVASYQAVMNVLGLANPLILTIPAIVMPAVATSLQNNGLKGSKLHTLAMRYSLQFEFLIAPWLIVLLIWPRGALMAFYGKVTPYASQTTALRVGILVYILTVPMTVFGAVLTGAGKTKSNAAMQFAGAVASLLCAPPLIYVGGVVGTILADTAARGSRVWYADRAIRYFSNADCTIKTNIAESQEVLDRPSLT